jgi:excisionase family DNA binding protein
MNDRYISYRELCLMLGISKSTAYRRVEDGTLPAPIHLGRMVRFRASDIAVAIRKLG